MKIEISLADNGKPLASSYSKFYTSQGDPIVDVIVREAIQNSLDAGLSTHQQADEKDYVKVDFSVGRFVSRLFTSHLEGITEKIDKLYPDESYPYLSIRDTYTSGLTGALNFQECNDPYNPGNLIKLVFNIAQPNTDEGAGGSCGIGKTIFYTLGAGIIIYYSRIYDGTTFQSRLVLSMIEMKHTKIIPDLNGDKNIGIAWWGDKYKNRDNKIIPITDETRINEFLSIFGIAPYKDKETGTTLIIPYINEDELASRNAKIGNQSLEKCIRDAVQRWYFPRLLNPTYTEYFSNSGLPNGSRKYLMVSINGDDITKKSFYPVFNVYQCLYNYSIIGENSSEEKKYLKEIGIDIKERIDIRINGKLYRNNISGYLAYCYASKESLGITPPDNNPTPHKFFYLMDSDENTNTSSEPILGFCRRAGMIGSYNGEGWLKGVPELPDDKSDQFLLSMFVLNSSAHIISQTDDDAPGILLDEYVRRSELNDHKDWRNDAYKIIEKIKRNTASKLSSEIKALKNDDGEQSQREGKLAKALSDKLLPPMGFGRKATPPAKDSERRKSTSTQSHSTLKLISSRYEKDYVIASYEFSKGSHVTHISFDLRILLDNSKISLTDWKSMGLPIPFGIEEIEIYANEKFVSKVNNSKQSGKIDDIIFESKQIKALNVFHGLDLRFKNITESFVGSLKFKIVFFDRSVKPIITYKNS